VNNKPYILEGSKPLCQECVHVDRCSQSHENEYRCPHQETKQDILDKKAKRDRIIDIISTKSGARELWDDINKYIYNPNLNTGNSLTQYNLGARGKVLDRVTELCLALELHDHTDLTVYLHNILTKE
jgi:hypothetical protein